MRGGGSGSWEWQWEWSVRLLGKSRTLTRRCPAHQREYFSTREDSRFLNGDDGGNFLGHYLNYSGRSIIGEVVKCLCHPNKLARRMRLTASAV